MNNVQWDPSGWYGNQGYGYPQGQPLAYAGAGQYEDYYGYYNEYPGYSTQSPEAMLFLGDSGETGTSNDVKEGSVDGGRDGERDGWMVPVRYASKMKSKDRNSHADAILKHRFVSPDVAGDGGDSVLHDSF